MHAQTLEATARCHCGATLTAQGETPLRLARLLQCHGWRLVWTGRVIRVWGCSAECARRLLPAIRVGIGETVAC